MINLLCDFEQASAIIHGLGLEYKRAGKAVLPGYDFAVDADQRFYFVESAACAKSFDVLHMPKDSVWKLDKFQSCLLYEKECVTADSTEYIIYTRRAANLDNLRLDSLEKISSYCPEALQLKMCDVYFMIPGKIDLKNSKVCSLDCVTHPLFDTFKANIEAAINEEYSSDFLKNMDRRCLFETTVRITSADQTQFFQNGLVGCVLHPSGFCILEIMLPCCVFGGNKLLNYYCGEAVEFRFRDRYYSINALLKELGIRRFGRKRSMVFSYGDISHEETVNALANEEFPMGTIDGDFFKTISTTNIAQYDTAKVYVSSETVLEVCNYINIFPDKRILYHVIEIFFVEMILFQDAAIDKIHFDLHNICQDMAADVDLAVTRSDEISMEMTQALKFADYNYFLFPSVRESAKTISKAFGIDRIYEKYEHDKYLIDTIIKSNARKWQEKQDRIKNRFLFLISALSTVGVLGEIIHFFFEDAHTSAFSYISALVIVSSFFGAYKLVMKYKNK